MDIASQPRRSAISAGGTSRTSLPSADWKALRGGAVAGICRYAVVGLHRVLELLDAHPEGGLEGAILVLTSLDGLLRSGPCATPTFPSCFPGPSSQVVHDLPGLQIEHVARQPRSSRRSCASRRILS